MKLRTLGVAAAGLIIGFGVIGASVAEAHGYHRHHGHGRGAAIVGGAILGLGLAAALSRPRYYDHPGYYYDDYGYAPPPPPRRYYRPPPRAYYYDDYAGPYDYPDSYAKEKIKRRNQFRD